MTRWWNLIGRISRVSAQSHFCDPSPKTRCMNLVAKVWKYVVMRNFDRMFALNTTMFYCSNMGPFLSDWLVLQRSLNTVMRMDNSRTEHLQRIALIVIGKLLHSILMHDHYPILDSGNVMLECCYVALLFATQNQLCYERPFDQWNRTNVLLQFGLRVKISSILQCSATNEKEGVKRVIYFLERN